MEIRGLRAEETEEVVALQGAAFGPGGLDYFCRHIVGDSSFRLDHIRVAVVDGRLDRVRVRDNRGPSRSLRPKRSGNCAGCVQ